MNLPFRQPFELGIVIDEPPDSELDILTVSDRADHIGSSLLYDSM